MMATNVNDVVKMSETAIGLLSLTSPEVINTPTKQHFASDGSVK